ncbi:MAG: hypothetical protein Q9159_001580 [Coniocarpon cinnabarinum]
MPPGRAVRSVDGQSAQVIRHGRARRASGPRRCFLEQGVVVSIDLGPTNDTCSAPSMQRVTPRPGASVRRLAARAGLAPSPALYDRSRRGQEQEQGAEDEEELKEKKKKKKKRARLTAATGKLPRLPDAVAETRSGRRSCDCANGPPNQSDGASSASPPALAAPLHQYPL